MSQLLEKVIYWFRQDLRLHDNIALTQAHASSKNVLHVTHSLSDELTGWGFHRHSLNRKIFRHQAIDKLKYTLEQHHQELTCFDVSVETLKDHPLGKSVDASGNVVVTTLIIDFARQHNIKDIFCEALETPEEQQQIQDLKHAGLIVHDTLQSSLYEDDQLPFAPAETPDIFTNFRQAVEGSNKYKKQQQPRRPLVSLFPLTHHADNTLLNKPQLVYAVDERSSFPFDQVQWMGDENSALHHVSRYFASQHPQTYKQTRNALTGIHYSTHFSPWLANGALSPRTIWQALEKHEQEQGANDSTYWIGFELLWREHFRLMARKHGAALFKQNGLNKIPQRNQSESTHHSFERWQAGETDHPFINAAMHELVTTGFLSNRLRQIVASYAIHDMGINWLAGAAWFEHCLIDYDVHSNQGNWAYIAGVGTDPRGGRRFNTDKQMKEYDPNGSYLKRWQA